jgi:putative membrane protein
MEYACRAASWPVVFRRDGEALVSGASATAALRTALSSSLSILERGRILLVFPEGYPTIDPGYTPKTSDTEFLSFQSGFARLVRAAATRGLQVPIVPAGFHYTHEPKWQVDLRFGEPVRMTESTSQRELVGHIESCVHRLSEATG